MAKKPTTPNRVSVSLQTSLAKDAPPETLLTGPAAVTLIGDATHADIILQPNNGEFIAAHRAYLLRNPYFASHESFVAHQDKSAETIVKISPPHPTEFRFLLQCIYANTSEYCDGAIRKQNFLPLLLNAQFFLEENVLAACAKWFHDNWRDAIQLDDFNCHLIDYDTLASLIREFNAETEATTKLHVILQWARNWDEENDWKPLREFVDSHVDFKRIGLTEWIELTTAHERGVEFCIAPKTHLHFVITPRATCKIYCTNCRQYVDIFEFSIPNACQHKHSHHNQHWNHISKQIA
ncbi:hypothetical protein HDU98_006068 [Podochytrium sp. JEL0797]|nr:hypothetical protein HDU98_006068 [Podochytrium sp. JEL0797]